MQEFKEAYGEISLYFPLGVRDLIFNYYRSKRERFARKWKHGITLNNLSRLLVSGDLVYIFDSFNDYIRIFSKKGKLLKHWDLNALNRGTFIGIAISDGQIYLDCMMGAQVDIFSQIRDNFNEIDFEFSRSWTPEPYSVTSSLCDISGNEIYAFDFVRSRIQIFSKHSGEILRNWDVKGEIFNNLKIVVHGNEVYTIDSIDNCIRVFTQEGKLSQEDSIKPIRTWSAIKNCSNDKENYPFHPDRLTISEYDEVYIIDSHNHQVHIFAKGLENQGPIRLVGSRGLDDGQFLYPKDLTISNDELFILDSDHVQVFKIE